MPYYFKVFELLILMIFFHGIQCHEWFCFNPISIRKFSLYHINNYISGQITKLILVEFHYIDKLTPTPINDKFIIIIWKFVRERKFHMIETFFCYWIFCLDELMMVWLKNNTCSDWMVVPQKPHQFGNDWHTIWCALCWIISHMELMEVKYLPTHLPEPMFEGLGNMASLLLLGGELIKPEIKKKCRN